MPGNGEKNFTLMSASLALLCLGQAHGSQASEENAAAQGPPAPVCAADASPYRDFDFLIGHWEFFSLDGEKIGEHVYTSREEGCLILEDWSTLSGSTGTGMNFVDPATGLWRQVWMSPLFHIDYSGALDGDGVMTLEGRIYPNSGAESAPVRGVYTRQDDGSIRKEFLQYNEEDSAWRTFFVGVSRPKAP